MIGEIFITRSGYDPELGKLVKDPYLGDVPSLGICRPDIRKRVVPGDYIFVVSGRVPGAQQYVIGGFEVEDKIHAMAAFRRFPEQRLKQLGGGQIGGNIIVNARGRQHRLDEHPGFERRIDNYVIGKNPIALTTPAEIARGRAETLDVLREIMRKHGQAPINVIGRGSKLTEEQVLQLRDWLYSIKTAR
jgi:hypothetical protein